MGARGGKLSVPVQLPAAVALGIEVLDLRDDRAHFGRFRWAASLHDVVNTLLWPTLLALLARFWWRGPVGSGES